MTAERAPAIEVVTNSGRPARAATATCTRAACKRRQRRLSCGALAPQANGDGDMRVGNRREADSVSERDRGNSSLPCGIASRVCPRTALIEEKIRHETSRTYWRQDPTTRHVKHKTNILPLIYQPSARGSLLCTFAPQHRRAAAPAPRLSAWLGRREARACRLPPLH